MEINFIKHITVGRLINVVKVLASYQLSKLLKKPRVWGEPVSYSIEPTNHCNLRCPECPSGLGTLTRPLGLLKFDAFKRLIDQINRTGFYVQLFFQGEPYLNKQLSAMISYAQKKKMYVSVSTNGLLITEDSIDKILTTAPDKLIFSIDGLDEKSYQKYRVGGSFDKVDKNLRLLLNTRKDRNLKHPFVELQFIAMKHNEHQIDDVHQYGKQVGVDKVTIKTMQVSSYSNGEEYLPSNQVYSRYNIDDGKIKIKGKIKNQCFALWRTSVITWDGRVVPCCFDKDAEHEFAILNGQPFHEIWNGNESNEFRGKIFTDRKGVDMCRNCTEGLKVNIMEI